MMEGDSPEDINLNLSVYLQNEITSDLLRKMKQLLSSRVGRAQLEEADVLCVFNLMSDKGIISVGKYEELKKLVTRAGKPQLVEKIEEAEYRISNYYQAFQVEAGAPQQANQESLNQMYT